MSDKDISLKELNDMDEWRQVDNGDYHEEYEIDRKERYRSMHENG